MIYQVMKLDHTTNNRQIFYNIDLELIFQKWPKIQVYFHQERIRNERSYKVMRTDRNGPI